MSNPSTPIREWSDGYVALKRRSESVRGWIEVNPDTPDATRWPRNTGSDVITIAAFIEVRLRGTPGFDESGIARRWRACIADMNRYALAHRTETYPAGRSFWNCLAAAFVYLSSTEALLPPQAAWDALLADIGRFPRARNVGPKGAGPFQAFPNVKTFDDLYLAQYKHLRDLRGADRLDPEPGMGGGNLPVPRSTNADVLALADYWSAQLAAVKRVMGHDAVAKTWREALADVQQLARGGDPSAVYPKNNRFWRTLKNTAIHVAVADEAPSTMDIAIDAVKDSIKHLPENLGKGAEIAATKVAEVAGDITEGAGAIVNKAAKGLFGGLGTPLLVAGGIIGGLLLLRGRGDAKATD